MTPLETHFETTVAGIPCGVHITSYQPFVPPTWDDPGEPEDVEYIVTDRKGYEAEWLERKMTKDDWRELDAEVLDEVRRMRQE